MGFYFIVGKEIEIRNSPRPGLFKTRAKVATEEINEAYPNSVRVRLFKKESDALRYASSLRKEPDTDNPLWFLSQKLRPVFKVTCCDEASFNWQEKTINYHYTQIHYEQGDFKHCPTTEQYEAISVETCLADLDKLVQISGNLRSYGYYETQSNKRELGNINYQSSCTLF